MNLSHQTHEYFLKEALVLAEERKGFCSPNPSVGAILLREDGSTIKGMHWQAGDPHAEVMVLSQLSPEETAGAVLYVTLEPCAHTGKTPPCTDLLIKHKLSAVYYGLKDPNPLVCGKGQAKLREAGMICEHIPCAQIDAFYQSYIWWTKHRRPWITAKLALSLDGKIAGANGVPQQITGEALNIYTHQARMKSDAILTTAKTIIRDDPQLNARLGNQIYAKPLYVIDPRLDIQISAKIFKTGAQCCIFHLKSASSDKKDAFIAQGVHCVAVPEKDDRLSLQYIVDYLGKEAGVHELWVEAGGACFQGLLLEQLVQRILIYIAPKTLGFQALSAFSVTDNLFKNISIITWQQFGQDVLCEMLYQE
ncbi:MAG: ribD [Gammaproteobacteria bacterium]|jgi:diaminohydroxyphosphoribosylaminopyrimidine deaminase/5-amino-6-(5-phosphoribosylamino)uracil reductase|nr:ribD [Gammaproteobacteria bacterium]